MGDNTYRENYANGHRYFLDGERVPGVTTIVSNGFPKPALTKWAADTTAAYAVDNWRQLGKLTVSQRLKELSTALWKDRDGAAARGTDVHTIAEKLAHGEPVAVSERVSGYVAACQEFMRERVAETLLVEVPVFSRKHKYAGTADLVARLNDGQTWLLDWKTNRSGPFGDTAFQLAAYANADFMLTADSQEQDLPHIDRCGVVWLKPDGTYELYPYEVTKAVFREFLGIKTVAEASENSKYYRGDPL